MASAAVIWARVSRRGWANESSVAPTAHTTDPARNRARSVKSDRSVCRIGNGSDSPDVSISTWRSGLSAAPRGARRCSSVDGRSARMVQQTQPFFSTSVSCERRWMNDASRPMSPNSLTITAVPAPRPACSAALSSVVLPLPRHPVRVWTGINAGASSPYTFGAGKREIQCRAMSMPRANHTRSCVCT